LKRFLHIVFFVLGDSPAAEFYVPTFRNTLFHIYRWYMQEAAYTAYEVETGCSETSARKIRKPGNTPKEII